MPIKHPESGIWYTSFRIDKKRIRRSTETRDKKLAEQYEARLKRELWEQRKLGKKPDYSWREAVVRYLAEKEGKRDLKNDLCILRNLDPYLGLFLLRDVTRTAVDTAITDLTAKRRWSAARGNRHSALVRCLLNMAWKDWEWLDKPVPVRMQREERDEPLWLTPAQARTLVENAPEHWQAPLRFALHTGMRKGNIFGSKSLTWDKVDLDRGIAIISSSGSKSRHLLRIKLNRDAVELLQKLPHRKGHLFLYNNKPFQIGYSHWRRLIKRLDLPENLRFHDLRHTWTSWHVQAGTDREALRKLGNWSSMRMVENYGHLGEQMYDAAAGNIGGWEVGKKAAIPLKKKTRQKRV
jgi:integrase